MVIVYRLETVDGIGVYNTEALNCVHLDRQRHPLPQDDSLLMHNIGDRRIRGYHFGFSSIEQLRHWLYNDKWIRDVSKHGIFLSVYEAAEVYIGNSQMCFNRSTAYLKSQNNLIEFFKL